LPAKPAEPPRVAFAIGRKVGGAVVRNQLRRRLRHLLRDVVPALEPGAWLISAAAGAVGLTYDQLGVALTGAITEATAPGRRPAPGRGAAR
jgi:ribonuclease P protein component